jgi:hypothetical protein
MKHGLPEDANLKIVLRVFWMWGVAHSTVKPILPVIVILI